MKEKISKQIKNDTWENKTVATHIEREREITVFKRKSYNIYLNTLNTYIEYSCQSFNKAE